MTGDGHIHAIFSFAELQGGLGRLLAAKHIECGEGKFRLSRDFAKTFTSHANRSAYISDLGNATHEDRRPSSGDTLTGISGLHGRVSVWAFSPFGGKLPILE